MSKSPAKEAVKDAAIIHIAIEGDTFVATCPHLGNNPLGRATHKDDAKAVNQLIGQVQQHRRHYESKGQPVPWLDDMPACPAALKTLQITGLRPAKTAAIKPATTTNENTNKG